MVLLVEKTFYRSVRRAGRAAGLIVNRIENAIESGWPDVIMRGAGNFHAYAELKIAHGSKATIKVRPEQIIWAEEHAGIGGKTCILAQSQMDKTVFWEIPAEKIRHVAEHGCIGEPYLSVRQLPQVVRRWMGAHVNIQPAYSALVEERSQLENAKKRVLITGAALQIVRRTRLRHPRYHRGSHRSESPWGES